MFGGEVFRRHNYSTGCMRPFVPRTNKNEITTFEAATNFSLLAVAIHCQQMEVILGEWNKKLVVHWWDISEGTRERRSPHRAHPINFSHPHYNI